MSETLVLHISSHRILSNYETIQINKNTYFEYPIQLVNFWFAGEEWMHGHELCEDTAHTPHVDRSWVLLPTE